MICMYIEYYYSNYVLINLCLVLQSRTKYFQHSIDTVAWCQVLEAKSNRTIFRLEYSPSNAIYSDRNISGILFINYIRIDECVCVKKSKLMKVRNKLLEKIVKSQQIAVIIYYIVYKLIKHIMGKIKT